MALSMLAILNGLIYWNYARYYNAVSSVCVLIVLHVQTVYLNRRQCFVLYCWPVPLVGVALEHTVLSMPAGKGSESEPTAEATDNGEKRVSILCSELRRRL